MQENPFAVFPCQRAFLPDLKAWIAKKAPPTAVSVIFPNRRPGRHFYGLYAKDGQAAILPRVYSFEDVVGLWAANAEASSRRVASSLDQAAILRECVSEAARSNKPLARKFTDMTLEAFLPWGLKLAQLFEEIFIQGRKGVDIAHLEYQVGEPASSLLGSLGALDEVYRAKLAERGFITPGLSLFVAAENAAHVPAPLLPASDHLVIAAGFSSPTGCEETLLKSLWHLGAKICLHADYKIAAKKRPHAAFSEQLAWISRWRASTEPAVDLYEAETAPKVKFFAGYDLHSQLRELNSEIEKNKSLSTVIVLADENDLLPTLHNLEEKKVNITMGYPMARAPLARLLEAIAAIRENDPGDGRVSRKDLRAVLAHPFLHLLSARDEDGNPVYLRAEFRKLVQSLSDYPPRLFLDDFLAQAEKIVEPALQPLFEECARLALRRPAELDSFGSLALWLGELREFLLKNGEDIWEKFPLDGETLYRLSTVVIPMLQDNMLADEKLPASVILDYFRSLVSQERIPFTVENLDGIQIMGLLETRLLNFDRVFILDAVDDALPGSMPRDSLLPNSLRGVLGLPDSKRREKNLAYHLRRLGMGAKETHYYWQEGGVSSNMADGKKRRSRFVEQLIWEMERDQLKNILEPDGNILKVALAPASIPLQDPQSIPVQGEIRSRLDEFLKAPLSASALDAYLGCPVSFAYDRLLKIKAPQTLDDGEDAALIGKVVHEALKHIFQPLRNKTINLERFRDAGERTRLLRASFEHAARLHEPQKFLPAYSWLKLEAAFHKYIGAYLEKFPEDVLVRETEAELAAEVYLFGKKHIFKGRIDRLDERNGKLKILDYKTGSTPPCSQEFWTNDDFFTKAEEHCRQEKDWASLNECAEELRASLSSLQLPFYLALLNARGDYGVPDDAAFVKLGENSEAWLFKKTEDEEAPKNALERCGIAIALVLEHLRRAPAFIARPSDYCRFCSHHDICRA